MVKCIFTDKKDKDARKQRSKKRKVKIFFNLDFFLFFACENEKLLQSWSDYACLSCYTMKETSMLEEF